MILDGILILVVLFAAYKGRNLGLFRTLAKCISIPLAWLSYSYFGNTLRFCLMKTELYKSTEVNVLFRVKDAVRTGETGILTPFIRAAEDMQAVDKITQSIMYTLSSAVIFAVLFIAIWLLVYILDKTVLHLPLLRPLNKVLGILWNVVFSIFLAYLAIGIIGTAWAATETEFWYQQMQSSYLVRGMYENNIVLSILLLKR